MRLINPDEVMAIKSTLERALSPYGFEFYPFKVLWYNSFLKPSFKLNFNEDSLAFLIISTPRMFENAFIPFLKSKEGQLEGVHDPIDECVAYYLSKVEQIFPENDIKTIYDFELHPNRRPKVIMQSIAHAAGAAYFYHPEHICSDEWKDKKMYGVCVHPQYGGWFALRAVVFFDDLACPELPKPFPYDVVPNYEDRIKLLELYNFHWKDWRFRDIIPVTEKYSEHQIKYFSTPPGDRGEVIQSILTADNAVNGH